MARTAPAPNIPPMPGMCPSLAVMGGGGDGGDADGDGSAGGGGGGGAGKGGGKKGAPDPNKYPKTGQGGEPVDVITGRMYTLPRVDLALPGPLPFVFSRVYSSTMADRDVGLGPGWAHSLGWRVETIRRGVRVWNDQGVAVDFDKVPVGGEVLGPWGWVLRRETWGYLVDADDGLWRAFSEAASGGKEHLLTAIQDRCGNRIALTYDAGRLVEVKDSAGRVIRFQATKEGRIGSVEVLNAVAQGRWVAFGSYAYDPEGNLVTATDADGFAERFAYDDRHLMTLHVDRVGLAFHYVYDREGRCTETWGDYLGKPDPSLAEGLPAVLADGRTPAKGVYHVRIAYFPDGYREVANSRQVQQYFGNEHGLVDKVADGGQVVSATYDERGHLLGETDAVGATTRYERDGRGRVTRVVDPLGREARYERDALGLPVRITDPAGGLREITRDRFGNVTASRNAVGAVTSLAYDERGLLTAMRDPNGGVTQLGYDAHGNLVRLGQPNGRIWQWKYDYFGQRLAEVDPLGATTWYRYSDRGDLRGTTGPNGGTKQYRYDGEGHPIEVVGPDGHTTAFKWGGYHSLCERVDPNGGSVRLRHGFQGELLRVENERGERHVLRHDALGNVVEEHTFDGRHLRYRRDSMGRVVRAENGAGEATEFVHNPAGEIVERILDDGTSESFEYDLLGNLARIEWPDGQCRFEHDALGRVVREVQVVGGETHSVDVGYYPNGRRRTRSTSLEHRLQIECDADGIPIRTVYDDEFVVLHQNDALGREIARTLPAGGCIESSFDAEGRLSRRISRRSVRAASLGQGEPEWLSAPHEGISAEAAYLYGPSGQITETRDRRRGAASYTYDPAGRLVGRLVDGQPVEELSYDATGNLLRQRADGEVSSYGPGNRLLRRGNVEYSWDAGGRLVEKRELGDGAVARIWKYHWNAKGLLESVARPDGVLVEFRYDPLSRRTEKQVFAPEAPGGAARLVSKTRFVWDQRVVVHEIKTSAQAEGDPVVEERTYVYQPGSFTPQAHRDRKRLAEAEERSGWYQYLNDPAGTPERLVRPDGEIAAELPRSTWGQVEADRKAETKTPIRSQGQYEDEETGLCYNRYRYYDAEIGRFISADPIDISGGLNVFSRGTSPLSDVDPLGLARSYPFDIEAAAAAGDLQNDEEKTLWNQIDKSRTSSQRELRGPGQGDCGPKAKNFWSNDSQNRKLIEMRPIKGNDLGANPGLAQTPSGKWSYHAGVELPGGRVVDPDSGKIFENKQQWVDKTVVDPSKVDTEYG